MWSLLLLAGALLAPVPAELKEVAREDGVVVSQRNEEGAALPRFRATVTVPVGLAKVAAVVRDGNRHHQWFHNTVESKVLDRTKRVFHVYQRLRAQPPVAARDVVLRVERFDEGPVCRFRFRAVGQHEGARPRDGIVRMRQLDGQFVLRRVGRLRTQVTYEVLADPGGRLPPWMARRGLRDMPLETLRNLRSLLARP